MISPGEHRLVAHYPLLDRLGEGAMGIVYRAEDTRPGRTAALKPLADRLRNDPVSLERFLREARTAASINHPNVCTTFDVHDGTRAVEPFIAMEFNEEMTLRRQIQQHRVQDELYSGERHA